MTTQQLNIDASQAIEELKKINQQLADMNNKTNKIEKETKETTSKMSKYWTELNSKYEFFRKGISDGVSLLTKFKDTIMSMESIQTQQTALTLLSKQGKDLNETLNRTLEITKGVASGFDILPVVNKLLVNGFNLTSESLEKLIDVSGIYSSVTGDSMRSVMEMLARAGQKESQAVLERIGVYVDIDNELKKYAKTIGTTVEMLTEEEKQTQVMIISTEAMKKKFDELGLSAASLESPITNTFNRASESVKYFTNEIVRAGATWYVESINWTSNAMEKYEEFSDRLQAFVQDGFEGRDRVAKKWAEKRYWEQQEALKIEIQENEKAEMMKTDTFIAYSEQQKAYGITNNEIIYANYLKLLSNLSAAQGKTIFISSKLFDIDPSKDKRNLANEMFFTEAEVDDYTKKSIEKYQKYWDALSKEQEKILKNKMSKLEQQYKNKQDLAIQQSKFNDSLFQTGIIVDDDFFQATEMTKRQQAMNEQMQELEKQSSENRINLKKREHEILLAQEKEYQDIAKSYLIDATNNIYSGIINSRENFLQETIALSMQRAGAEIFNDGLQGLWQGGRWMLSPYPTMSAQGAAMVGYSVAEMGAGIGLGYAGAAAMPSVGGKSSESKNKETAARDRLQNFDTQKKEAVVTYLYPDERTAIQQLSKMNKKF